MFTSFITKGYLKWPRAKPPPQKKYGRPHGFESLHSLEVSLGNHNKPSMNHGEVLERQFKLLILLKHLENYLRDHFYMFCYKIFIS